MRDNPYARVRFAIASRILIGIQSPTGHHAAMPVGRVPRVVARPLQWGVDSLATL